MSRRRRFDCKAQLKHERLNIKLNRRGKSWLSHEDTKASSTLSNVSQPHFQPIFLEQNFLQILLKTFFCSNKNINLRGEWKMWKKKNSA